MKPATSNLAGEQRIYSRWPEWLTLCSYAVIVAFAISWHEPWPDDAQAWQLARSLSLPDLFQTYIRYEGSPGLWHFLLWILSRTHVNYQGLHWICGVIAVASTALLVFFSPFPRYLKLTLPFTYFLVFQYAVAARSYVLVPPLLFAIATQWKKRPLIVVFLLGLLANLALHAAIISGGLAIVLLIEQIRTGCLADRARMRKLILCAMILICLYSFAIWTAWPPSDMPNHISGVRGQGRSFIYSAIGSLVGGILQPWVFSVPFWFAIGFCLHKRGRLIFLIPVFFFAVFSGAVYANFWHVGLLVPLVISILWITWPASENSTYEISGRVALISLVCIQILWSAHALIFDRNHATSPDLATANFLRPFANANQTIAVTYLDSHTRAYPAIGILPYFNRNIFENFDSPFWSWKDNNPSEDRYLAILPSRPRLVVVETNSNLDPLIDLSNTKVQTLFRSGYQFTNLFCGSSPERFGIGATICHMIFQSRNQSLIERPIASPNQRSGKTN